MYQALQKQPRRTVALSGEHDSFVAPFMEFHRKTDRRVAIAVPIRLAANPRTQNRAFAALAKINRRIPKFTLTIRKKPLFATVQFRPLRPHS